MYPRLAYIISLLVLQLSLIAQPVLTITASKKTVRTGEPDTIQLRADWPGHSLEKGFIVPDSFPHFEVWDKGKVLVNENGFTQQMVVASYDSGKFSLPPLELNEMNNTKSDSLSINVQPVNVDSLKDYHDIKDIIEVPPVPQWPFVLFIAGITIISLLALYFLFKKTSVGRETTTRKVKLGTYEQALEDLEKLEWQIQQPGPSKPFYTSLTNIYRNYLSETYKFRSLQQTGGELIIQAKPLLNEADFYQLANSIRLSDAVKFAKYEPAKADWVTSLSAFRQSIEALQKRMITTTGQTTSPKEEKLNKAQTS